MVGGFVGEENKAEALYGDWKTVIVTTSEAAVEVEDRCQERVFPE